MINIMLKFKLKDDFFFKILKIGLIFQNVFILLQIILIFPSFLQIIDMEIYHMSSHDKKDKMIFCPD